MLSNQLVNRRDPQTPIFTAAVGDKARFRLMHPFGTGTSQVFTLHGHVWQRNPYKNDSKEIGDNSLSQWIGSRDNHGSTDHFDIMVDKAGGEGGRRRRLPVHGFSASADGPGRLGSVPCWSKQRAAATQRCVYTDHVAHDGACARCYSTDTEE